MPFFEFERANASVCPDGLLITAATHSPMTLQGSQRLAFIAIKF